MLVVGMLMLAALIGFTPCASTLLRFIFETVIPIFGYVKPNTEEY